MKLTEKEKIALDRALNLLIAEENDTINYTQLYNKLGLSKAEKMKDKEIAFKGMSKLNEKLIIENRRLKQKFSFIKSTIYLKAEEQKETIEMLNRLVKQQQKDISQLKNKLKNCVSPDVLKWNYEEVIREAKANKASIRVINKASNKFDKSIKAIKKGLK